MPRHLDAEELANLESRLGLTFHDKRLLREAFVHGSYVNETPKALGGVKSYERLEFLGDALIGLTVASYYYQKSEGSEGVLTNLRKAKVEEMAEARAAKNLNLGDYLSLGRGAERDGARTNQRILADCYEAVMGASFLDLGYEVAAKSVVRTLIEIES